VATLCKICLSTAQLVFQQINLTFWCFVFPFTNSQEFTVGYKVLVLCNKLRLTTSRKILRLKVCIPKCVGYTCITFTDGVEVSKCYLLNSENYCFYSDSSVLLGWDEAREFCARRNSTLPIITDEDVDNVFQQFIVSDSYNLIQNRSVWIAAHARPVNNSVSWHWIDGQQSSNDITVVE